MVRLEQMTDEQFSDYLDYAVASYGNSMVRSGRWQAGEAPELAQRTILDLLTRGLRTPGHHFFSVTREDGKVVGYLWLGEGDRGAGTYAYIYDFVILEPYRRRGYGRQALGQMEEKVREMGLNMIMAHVYSENYVARALYDTIGYTVDEVTITKCVE